MDVVSAFKLYDIRGQYPEEVDERLAFLVGRALDGWKLPKSVLVASDLRPSSPGIKKYLVDGLALHGTKVLDLGEVPFPQFLFTMATERYDLGVMVTASHVNTGENGFKIVKSGAVPLDQSEVLFLKQMVKNREREEIVVLSQPASLIDSKDKYIQALIMRVRVKKFKRKLVVDIGSSSVCNVVPEVLEQLGVQHKLSVTTHGGDILLTSNRKALSEKVIEEKADLGVVWDSDGDRTAFVDSRGVFIPMSFVFGFLAEKAIKDGLGKKVAVDVRAGLVVKEMVESAGGKLQIFPAWNQNFKFMMEEDPSIGFGGEVSGHFIFNDFYTIDDGILAALRFLEFSEEENLRGRILNLRRRYFELPERNFPCSFAKSIVVLSNLTDYYRGRDMLVSTMDGLTVFGKNWKFNLRESATEPYLRLNLEASDEEAVQGIVEKIESNL